MSDLHYRIIRLGHEWVLWSEGVPVERFASRDAALRAGEAFVAAARRRGDRASLAVNGRPHGPAPHRKRAA